jgi:hypothetical protein
MIYSVSGEKRSGKDTIGLIIQGIYAGFNNNQIQTIIEKGECNSSPLTIQKFADVLSSVYFILTGINYKELKGDIKEHHRKYICKLADALKDVFYEDIFISAFPNENLKDCIVTDARYLNEINFLVAEGATTILVINNRVSNNDTHSSENEFKSYDNFNHVVHNNGSIEDLINKVRKICQ